jgi:predicted transcriptional regulator
VALLGIIRRWHIRDQVPLREIARRLGISRNTVRRYLRSETIEPAYAERRSTRAIDKYAFQLSALLKTEAAKSRKQRRTLKQIHEDLKELGFEGSYDRVAAFARTWREGQTERVNPASKRTVKQDKTRKRLRIEIIGELKKLLERIENRNAGHKVITDALLVNRHGKRLTV